MSHPLLVEAIESRFVPMLVYNNRKNDRELLNRFDEPAWNNPVIRFFDADLVDLLARKDEVWKFGEVASHLIKGIRAADREPPTYLKLGQTEYALQTESASFAMHCYWEGEVQFGKLPGVISTQTGWYNETEIVNVVFDPSAMTYRELVTDAIRSRCAATIYTRTAAQKNIAMKLVDGKKEKNKVVAVTKFPLGRLAEEKDQKYYLKASPFSLLPLISAQEVRINSALGSRENALDFLSPRQRELFVKLKKRLSDDQVLIAQLKQATAEMDFQQYFRYLQEIAR